MFSTETYYQVVSKTEKGLEVVYKRDTVERGYQLYRSLKEDGESNIKLEEVSNNGIALLRGAGCYEKKHKQPNYEEKHKQPKDTKQSKDMFEMMFGISRKEYNDCLLRWNRLTGDNIDLL